MKKIAKTLEGALGSDVIKGDLVEAINDIGTFNDLEEVLSPIVEELEGIREALEQANDIKLSLLSPPEMFYYESQRNKRHREKAGFTESRRVDKHRKTDDNESS